MTFKKSWKDKRAQIDIDGLFKGKFDVDMETDVEGLTFIGAHLEDNSRYTINTKFPGLLFDSG